MKIICIGRNYPLHIGEMNNETPEEPVVFLKPESAMLPKRNPFYIPAFSHDVHHEVEVIVKINRLGKYIAPQFAHKYYEEIGLGIDFTARDVQSDLKAKGLPWEKAKAFDGSAVIGKFIHKDLLTNPDAIPFCLLKNGEEVQKGNTRDMLWSIDELISYVSRFFTLKTGDILFTGTPAGVGKVESGDVLTAFLEEQLNLKVNIK